MDVEIPVLAGYLNFPTQSGFSLNRISKKKSSHRYCLLFNSSRHGIERLEICESKEDKNPKIITLENCVKITQEPSPANLIQIVKKTGTLTLNTLTEEDLKEWINALQNVAFRDKGGACRLQAAIEEDNDLYCSSFGDGLFVTTLIPSETSIRCSIDPKTYMLHLTATELKLKSADDINTIIARWPYRFIRKYGYRDGKFTFEAGRKCSTGEGVFILDHTNPQEVFRCMSAKMKSMKKLISEEKLNGIDNGENQLSIAASMEAGSRSPLPHSPSNQRVSDLEVNSTQSCMSLRGFLSSSDSLNNFSNTSTSAPPIKNIPNKPPRKLPISNDKHLTSPSNTNSTMALELKSPVCQINCDQSKKFQSYEPVSITTSTDPNKTVGSTVILKPSSPDIIRNNIALHSQGWNDIGKTTEFDYESIETITNAWKTFGISDVKHTERTIGIASDDDLIDLEWQRSLTQREKNAFKEILLQEKVRKIIDIDIGESGNCINSVVGDVNYDRLDFLSPNNKTSSGYKTIVKVATPTNRLRCSTPPPNEYEFIASPDIQPCRKADDTHLGYGVLRKSTTSTIKITQNVSANNKMSTNLSTTDAMKTSNATSTTLDHLNYNGINYTIVSKPKRV